MSSIVVFDAFPIEFIQLQKRHRVC